MTFEQDLLSLETNLLATSDPAVLSDFYGPVQKSLEVISSALDTLDEDRSERSKEKEHVSIEVIEEQVTQSLQTISLWTECAEESIGTGNLAKWTHSAIFQKENDTVMEKVDEIMRKINRIHSEYLNILKQNVIPVKQKICLFVDIALESSKRNLIRIEIDGSISESSLPQLSTIPWNYQERVDSMPPLGQFQTMESNIFWFSSTSKAPPQKCSIIQDTEQPLTFFVASKAVHYVADTALQANVLSDGKWQLHETQCQGEYVMFQTDKVDAFFIVGTPREREFRVDPSGGRYVHRTDKRVRLDFPEGSVKESQNFKVTVFPVKVDEMVKRKRMFPNEYKFLSVTKGIHVSGSAFTKAVKVQLPLEQIENTDEADEQADTEYVFFHIDGENVKRMTDQHIQQSGDTIITDVETFSSYVGAKVRRDSVNSLSSMEVLIAFGFKYHCKLMTFVKKTSEEFVQVWCELVKKENWKKLEEKRLEEHPNLQKIKDSDSQDIFIAERQRVRVDVKGNSFVGQDVPKNSLLITFFPIAEDNHIFPPLRKKGGMHGVPYTTITYSMDSGKKTSLHTLSFDPWTLRRVKKPNPDPTGGRAQSATKNMNSSSKINVDRTKNQSSTRGAEKEKSTARLAERSTKGNDDKPTTGDISSPSATRVVESSSGNEGNISLGNDSGSSSKFVATTNISSPDPDPDRHRAQAAVSNRTKAYYSKHFDEFLNDFEIEFVGEKLKEHGIDDLDTFLRLKEDHLMNIVGLNLGRSLKCINAQQKFNELER